MVKRREPQATTNAKREPTPEQIEAFAAAADGGSPAKKPTPKADLDPNANRDYKAIRVPFNEYEFTKLEELATKTGRTKLNVIRWAILKLAEEVQEGH
ncbi:hypothetical protein Q672_13285 [Marinobacter sp. EVN1]|jgi:hypothetical protein|uniref:hypothetical protein n=2 Tax=Gammaproteobacteria TaxID=1236 RepID=UPI0003B8D859|nr:hypothetical protein [Marinobacter sp. EVN1]ERS87052.1 hypothetical protein Q672_13285 [Marinobacter sp. EVN1]